MHAVAQFVLYINKIQMQPLQQTKHVLAALDLYNQPAQMSPQSCLYTKSTIYSTGWRRIHIPFIE